MGTPKTRATNAHVQGLLEKIRSYEEQLSTLSQGPPPLPNNVEPGPFTSSASMRDELPAENLSDRESIAGITPTTDLTSGPAFETQVRSLLGQNPPPHGTHAAMFPTSNPGPETQWTSARPLVRDDAVLTLPPLEKSEHLLDRFLFYLGVSQHFFDPRTFSDCMMMLYQDQPTRDAQMRTVWFTEYLLVMAMAQLMDVEDPASQPPGAIFFAEAMKRLPPLHQLGEEGVIAVEILTLIATYLQWCDRKHDAYLYIGLALRLAIALGCGKPPKEHGCLPSQTAHRVRLWWTVYMLDRRLSSGLGFAAGADERQLRAELPRQAIGFQSPLALAINIRIARTTDCIMSSLYGNASITQMELVCQVQKVLHDLYDIGQSFPPALALDFSRPLQTVTRTGASLYLMLFQAIILCIRPILLQRVRQGVERQRTQPPPSVSTVLTRLCETCNEAATKSLAILYNLQAQKIIPRYGFFDLDATFSAAFVLVMMGFVDKTQPPPAIAQAFAVLRFLIRAGNPAADRRLHDITQSCLHVWPNYTPAEDADHRDLHPAAPTARIPARISIRSGSPSTGSGLAPPPPSPPPPPLPYTTAPSERNDESGLLEVWTHSGPGNVAFDMPEQWDMDLSGDAEGVYTSFYDPMLPLTGVDHLDWLEIEKLFDRRTGQ
ncbi:hypothetical protein BO78DRAFT_465280 [Aspergillus sclerotiicarbonarius CBS 121057]|uniref:Xylanolytic transcriptional activator regulatory domain-containing protein n=1 Tax=Aspergillus sclerotiicarbonarius (strain CBS 121057 / IBT 28362) TaxID=1448318 RepID=A0A319DSC2_ASPSB|nr:hypothetical protein BO78DRAFT_465280 [Aspergillus sclerotiicarbonarius CBS 121057]